MVITLSELETSFEVLLQMLRQRGFEEADSGSWDYYWVVLLDDWIDLKNVPDVATGSLDDDIAELKKLAGPDPVPTSVDLDRLASVFRLLAEQYSRQPLK